VARMSELLEIERKSVLEIGRIRISNAILSQLASQVYQSRIGELAARPGRIRELEIYQRYCQGF
jgi:hypothetical protein